MEASTTTAPTAPPPTRHNPISARTSLAELAALFLRLGGTAFGGPAAHIAMMRAEWWGGANG